jgi:hypothetical protein
MEFKPAHEDEWRAFESASDSAVRIRAKAVQLLTGVAAAITRANQESAISCKYDLVVSTEKNSAVLGELGTPVGDGRFVLEWDIHGKSFVGQLVLQRKRLDEFDRITWQPVWGIYVSAYDGFFVEKAVGPEKGGLNSGFPDDLNAALRAFGMTTVLAIAKGPLV